MILQCDLVTIKTVPWGHKCRSLRTQLGDKQKTVLEMLCAVKETSLLILLPIFTAPLSGQGRGRGYKSELKLIKGLKEVIYEKSLREINM